MNYRYNKLTLFIATSIFYFISTSVLSYAGDNWNSASKEAYFKMLDSQYYLFKKTDSSIGGDPVENCKILIDYSTKTMQNISSYKQKYIDQTPNQNIERLNFQYDILKELKSLSRIYINLKHKGYESALEIISDSVQGKYIGALKELFSYSRNQEYLSKHIIDDIVDLYRQNLDISNAFVNELAEHASN